jgi:hypothetical protein
MGNRSDRRLANLANPLALEAVIPNRGRIYECNRSYL